MSLSLVRIGEVARVQSGYAFKSEQFTNSGVRLLRNANILPGCIYWDELACIDEDEWGSFENYQLNIGDVLLSLDRPIISTGIKVARLTENDVPSLLVQRVGRFLLDKSFIDPEYLYIFLQSPNFISSVSGHEQSLGVPHISPAQIESIEIPLPQIEKQRQVAARLKAQLAEVDKARQAAEAQLRDVVVLSRRFRENTINQLADVPRAPLGELLLGIEAGKSFKTTELPARPDELGVLKVSAVSWNEFLPQEAKAIEDEYLPDGRHRVQKGDLIISRANTLELVGAVVRVADDYPMRLLSDKTLRLVVDEKKTLPDFLLTILRLPEARAHIENNATGTSDSMRNISQKTINTIPIPVLSLHKQRELMERFASFQHEMLLIEKSGKAMLTDINLLPQKILARAFEG